MKDIPKNATMLDVRTPAEFNESHYPGAINIPLDQIPGKMDEIKKLSTPIVAYCRSGNRSGMAVHLIKQNGITDIYNGGGLQDLLQTSKQ
jgi:phage shock protein E